MDLFGKSLTKDELRRRIGNMDQVAGLRVVERIDGPERPGRAALLHTGSGLELTVLLDRCLDISAASFRGRAMGWRSPTGDVAPQFYEPEGTRWLRSYFGGLLTTCGLRRVGPPGPGSALTGDGLHGRIGNTPARDVQTSQQWEDNDYVLRVQGVMRETTVFGENLVLERTIETRLGDKRIRVYDAVTNEGFTEMPFMLLYHCNIGWPALDAGSRLLAPSEAVAPRDDTARAGIAHCLEMDSPGAGAAEQVFYHAMTPNDDGRVTVALVNDRFDEGEGFGVAVTYDHAALPRFTQWKMLGEQTYVVGLEPCTCTVEGKEADEEAGRLEVLTPGERRHFALEFTAITTQEERDALEAKCGSGQPRVVASHEALP